MKLHFTLMLTVMLVVSACTSVQTLEPPPPDRENLIPLSQPKINPDIDVYPPRSVSEEYDQPVPLPYPVNTAGGEDSAFILPDGNTLFVFFTPDISKPPEDQVLDRVTGIYAFRRQETGWSAAGRVLLQDSGKLALDGCEFVQGDVIWFCSAREGYTGLHWFTATFRDSAWQDWQLADFDPAYEVGELHITADGSELYYHSSRSDGQGGLDLWVSRSENGVWQPPENVAVVNSALNEGWPFVTPDGTQLWFTRSPGAPELYRSIKQNGEWQPPTLMFTNFAGEASLDNQGNVYFTHHFFKDDQMLEADIYFARKR